jgi:Ca-activated chloride channel family protein
MKKGQLLLLLVAAAAVAIIAVVAGSGGSDPAGVGADAAPVTKAPRGAVKVAFGYSPEKEKALVPLIKAFNADRHVVDGRQVFIDGQVISSGEAERKLAAGQLKLDAWSPASSLWGRLLNFETDQPLVAEENPSIFRTPLVIAMWEPMARALGWPKQPLGFEDILRLTRSKAGWAQYGKPQYGDFKLVHTNPDYSTAGLSAVVAEYYAATGKREGLQTADLTGSARQTVRDIEQSIVHYGDTTLFVAEQLRKDGPGYASAVAMEEVTLLDFNRDRGNQPKLVALYPKEGTFYSDNPYIVLNGGWVTPAQKTAAAEFQKFLAQKVTPQVAAASGFRPADVKTAPVKPISAENGVDPKQPTRVLGLPEPRVLDALRKRWREDRKPANVLLVFDTSGSMNDENRLVRAKQGLEAFFREVAPQDRVGLTIFSDRIQPLIPIKRFSENQAALRDAANTLIADGGTAIYDATDAGVEAVSKLSDTTRINAVVVLTDGEDTDSTLTSEQVVSRLGAQGDSRNRVRVYTIAYSAGAAGAKEALADIANQSGGKAYDAGTDDIEAVYKSISSFF